MKAIYQLFIILLFAGISFSQENPSSKESNTAFCSVGGGLMFPISQTAFRKSYNSGYNIAAQVGLNRNSISTQVGFAVEYSKLTPKENINGFDVELTLIQITGKHAFPAVFYIQPFITGGFGFAHVHCDGITIGEFSVPSNQEISSTLSIGLGLQYEMFFIESKYQFTDFQKANTIYYKGTIPVRLGVEYKF